MKGKVPIILLSLLLIPSLTLVSVSSYLTDPYAPIIHQENPSLAYILISLYFLLFIPILWVMRKAKRKYEQEKLTEDSLNNYLDSK
ncbi:MAG: hypothetical protein FK730_11295 [Asgard group archaeon]|nr:hypothetical protein [Asgard group archaeon]